MRAPVVAALTAVVLLTAGCRETAWPSDADRAEFCAVVTGPGFPEGGDVAPLEQLGTPQDLPFEARRHLLDLDEGRQTDPVGVSALEEYVAGHC